ncbi:glycosyl hydrolase family 79 C-terminal domain-containing protein [Conexibacter sp. DBS9H8]|uniref:glycosyl hydrolase family 79 C-terminal domain-containing protein n=1 Tax=Conexibacter sp. DBS9H8 TaxID=2937801 RepID=UPI00200E220F|nr:glycosyl hydrolase family 79 C-terminal domain-containing protein [Conexibacter sp. DBS9H8]
MRTEPSQRRGGRRARRGALTLASVAAVGSLCAGCGGTSTAAITTAVHASRAASLSPTTLTGPTTSTPATARADVQVGTPAPVAPTSAAQGFVGIATELSTITHLSGSATHQNGAFVQLLRNLSPGSPLLLRLGGDSSDWSWWAVPGMAKPRAIRYTITPQWAAAVKSLLQAVGGKAILGVNLELDSPRVAAYEAREYERTLGPQLIDALELGNEPELYAAFNYYRLPDGRGVKGRVFGHYTIADYGRDFSHIAAGLGSDPIAGPSSGSPTWLPQLGSLLNGLPSRLKLVTVHAYPLKRCSASTHLNVSDFFTGASIGGLAGSVAHMAAAARAHHKPLRVDEINGISCGGEAGVSNTFAEALWALNVLPALWRAGAEGVNFQTVNGNLNEMISATDTRAGWRIGVQPEYFGLLTFADVAPAGSRLLQVRAPAVSGQYAYAVRDTSHVDRVVITNITRGARTVTVSAAGATGTGAVSLLTAPSLTATGDTTLGGQKLSAATGQLIGHPHDTLVKPNAAGVYAVRVPAHSAVILTVNS